MKSGTKRFALIGAGLCLCGLLAFGGLRVRQLRADAPAELARALARVTGLEARVEDARIDLGSNELLAHGLVLERGGRRVLTARELHVRLLGAAWLRGRLEVGAIDLRGVELALDASELERLASSAQRPPLPRFRVRDVKAVIELEALGRVELEARRVAWEQTRGSASIELEAASAKLERGGAPFARANLRVSGGHGLVLEGLNVRGQEFGAPVALTLGLGHGRLDAAGELKLADGAGVLGFALGLPLKAGAALELKLMPKALRIKAALAALNAEFANLDALVSGELEARGTLEPLALRGPLNVELRGLALTRAPASGAGDRRPLLTLEPLHVRGQVMLDAHGIVLPALALDTNGGTLQGDAKFPLDGTLALALQSDAFDLARAGSFAGVACAGHGRIELRASGPLSGPELRVALGLEAAAWAGVELGKVSADFRVYEAGAALEFERAVIERDGQRLDAESLHLRFDDGVSQAHAKIKVGSLPLAELYRLLGAPDDPSLSRLQGVARGSASLDYERGDRRGTSLALRLELGLLQPELDDYRFDSGQLRARIELPDPARGFGAGKLTLEQFSLKGGGASLDMTGVIERGAPSLELAFDKLALGRLPWMHAHASAIDARVSGRGKLSGRDAEMRAELELTLDELALRGHRLGHANLHAYLRPHGDTQGVANACEHARAALAGPGFEHGGWLICGDGLGQKLALDLALSADEQRRVRGQLALAGFELKEFLPVRDAGPMPGRLSATLVLSGGGLREPERLSGSLLVQKFELGEGDAALASVAPFRIAIHEGALELHGAKLDGPSQKLDLSAQGTLGQHPRLIAEGSVAASLLSHASQPLVQVFGDVAVHLEWSPTESPELRAEVELRELAVRIETLARIQKLNGKLVLQGERLRLEGVNAELGDGTLALAGELALSGLRVASYELKLHADHVALEPQPKLTVELDTDSRLSWAGPGTVPELSGRVRIDSLLYARHIQMPEALTALNRQDRNNLSSYVPARDRVHFDLEIEHEKPLRVHNNFLNGELRVAGPEHKLRVVGSDQRFGLVGTLELARGRLLYRGDSFDVTRGTVAFSDPNRVAPRFDVRAVADTKKRPDASIVLNVHGTREAFELKIQCEAPDASSLPPPFVCEYAHDDLRCDRFEELVQLWLCRPKTAVSSR